MSESPAGFDEHAVKRARVHDILARRGLEGILIRDPGTVSWYLDGARSHVLLLADVGVAAVLVRRDREEVRTSVIEAPRLVAEELRDDEVPVVALPWWEPLEAGLGIAPVSLGSDRPVDGVAGVDVAADLLAARAVLTPPEAARYRELARDTAAAVAAALRASRAGDAEWALAARGGQELIERGCDVVNLLVAGAARLPRHRHPLPTGAPLGERAMLVVCARRHGLVCSVTRIRAFAPVPAGERERYEALLRVEAAALDATRPGDRVGDAFRALSGAYAANGFDADEWHRHHQGGACGYAARDALATADSAEVVGDPQAFAWNPSGDGWKVEDTVLAASGGLEVLSVDPDWPTTEVAGRARPDVLV